MLVQRKRPKIITTKRFILLLGVLCLGGLVWWWQGRKQADESFNYRQALQEARTEAQLSVQRLSENARLAQDWAREAGGRELLEEIEAFRVQAEAVSYETMDGMKQDVTELSIKGQELAKKLYAQGKDDLAARMEGE
jgi:F0F1-type ATP synthase membrane subunit b/b'